MASHALAECQQDGSYGEHGAACRATGSHQAGLRRQWETKSRRAELECFDGERLVQNAGPNASAGYHLWPVPSGRLLRLCVPPKCGTTRWSELLLTMVTDVHPHDGFYTNTHLARLGYNAALLDPCAASLPRLAPRVTWIMVVRNPFERLLSGFLDKFAGPPTDGAVRLRVDLSPRGKCSRPERGGAAPCFNATPADFEDFVRLLTARPADGAPTTHRKRMTLNTYARFHALPLAHAHQTYSCVLAAVRALRDPSRAPAGGPRVLKLERMGDWYAALVAELGIQRAVSHRGWRKRGGCFWRPDDVSRGSERERCAEARTPRDVAAAAPVPRRAPPASRARGEQPLLGQPLRASSLSSRRDRLHDSSQKLRRFYTPQLAELVGSFAAADIELFGYPRWNPSVAGSVPW